MILFNDHLCCSIWRLTTDAAFGAHRRTARKQGGFRFEVVLISGRKSADRRVLLLFCSCLQHRSEGVVKCRYMGSQFFRYYMHFDDFAFRICIGTFAWLCCVYRTVWGGNFVGLPRGWWVELKFIEGGREGCKGVSTVPFIITRGVL